VHKKLKTEEGEGGAEGRDEEQREEKREEEARIAIAHVASEWWDWLSPMTVDQYSNDYYLIAFTSYADEAREESPRRKKMGTVGGQTHQPQPNNSASDSVWER
jgi:hypothetical protein